MGTEPVTTENKEKARHIYTRLPTLFDVYQERFKASESLLARADACLSALSSKFTLQSPIPYMVPIVNVSIPIAEKPKDLSEVFTYAQSDKLRPSRKLKRT